ncbi:MAG: hypothetical protein ACRD4B_03785 [Acidobacteriota bacterium]
MGWFRNTEYECVCNGCKATMFGWGKHTWRVSGPGVYKCDNSWKKNGKTMVCGKKVRAKKIHPKTSFIEW